MCVCVIRYNEQRATSGRFLVGNGVFFAFFLNFFNFKHFFLGGMRVTGAIARFVFAFPKKKYRNFLEKKHVTGATYAIFF